MPTEENFKKILLDDVKDAFADDIMSQVCEQYFNHYYRQSEFLRAKLRQIITKYNSNTILDYLGPNGYPEEFVHISLGHGYLKTTAVMLDNGTSVYPMDKEIGRVCEDPQECSDSDCCKNSVFNTDLYEDLGDEVYEKTINYHYIIYYCWLAINWIEVEGHSAKVVVKTCENNSLTSFFLNAFKYDRHSKFDLENDWRKTLDQYGRETIDIRELYNYLKENT